MPAGYCRPEGKCERHAAVTAAAAQPDHDPQGGDAPLADEAGGKRDELQARKQTKSGKEMLHSYFYWYKVIADKINILVQAGDCA